MRATIAVLGFLCGHLCGQQPSFLKFNKDEKTFAYPARLKKLGRQAQLRILQEMGFELAKSGRLTVTMQRPGQFPVEFWQLNFELHHNAEDAQPIEEAVIGFEVSGPFYAHLLDAPSRDQEKWRDAPTLSITPEIMAIVQSFKDEICAEYPDFQSAQLHLMTQFY